MDTHINIRRLWIILIFAGLVYIVEVNSQFLTEPQSAEVTQGIDHTLECVVNKTYLAGLFFLAWTKDSEVFSARNQIDKVALENINGEDPEDRYTITKVDQGDTGTYKLIIDQVKGVDSGNYQCVICEHPETTYMCTAITDFKSSVATFNVLYTPSVPEYPECNGLDSSATVSIGTQVEVTCVSEIGDPKVQLQWNKDGVPLLSTVTEREENNRLYLIYTFTAELSHTGMILSCSSTSPHFTSYSESCSFNALTVVDMPVVAVTSGAAEYEEGSPANFTCTASSATSITFEWSTGNIPSSRYTQNNMGMESVLTITSVIASDHQTAIKCVVRNEQGQTAEDQVFLEVIGGPTGIIPTSRMNPPTTKSVTTNSNEPKLTTTPVPEDSSNLGAAIGGAVAGIVIIILVILLAIYFCGKRKQKMDLSGKVMSIGSPPNGIGSHAPPTKKMDFDDDVKKEPLPITDEPDVVPRQHNGNHDPRSWWRESVPGDAYTKDDNEYPTIKRMQMPFNQRAPSLENLQERVEMDNYRSGSNGYVETDVYRETENISPASGRYDYNPPSVHSDNPALSYHDYHNPQFDQPESYHRPPSVDHYSEYSYQQEDPRMQHPQDDPRMQHPHPSVNYGPPPPQAQDRYDNYYNSYDRRNPANYGPRPGIDNPNFNSDMHVANDMYNARNPNYPDSYDPHGFSEDGSVFSSVTDRYYDQDSRIEGARSPAFYPDNNGYASSDRPISPYADIPPGQTNNSSDVLYMQGHDIDVTDPSYV